MSTFHQRPISSLAFTHIFELWFGSDYPIISFAQATKAVKKALALDNNNSYVYLALSYLSIMRKEHDKAIAAAERTIALNPSGADGYILMGFVLNNSDRPKEAIKYTEVAIRLNPFPPSNYYHELGFSYLDLKNYSMALKAFRKAIKVEESDVFAHQGLAITYSMLGRDKEAIESAKEVLRLNPKFSIQKLVKISPKKNRSKIYDDVLRKIGLPD